MKKEIYMCDICEEEAGAPRKGDGQVQVIFTTEQNEGRTTKPYFELVKIDWCEQCRHKALQGNVIFAEGAMGYNKYYFRDSTGEISKRQLHKMIEEEIWEKHVLTDEFLREHQTTPRMIDDINAMCLKSHNDVLEKLLDYLKI